MTVHTIRRDFELFRSEDPPVYFDNSATTQKPDYVIRAAEDFYKSSNANPLRGLYDLAMDATDRYEDARKTVASFIGAGDPSEVIFVRNTTESLNLVSECIASAVEIKEGDNIVVTVSEHHSNLLPWQRLSRRTGASLVFIEPDMTGLISDEELEKKITERTRLVSVAHVSNVWGRENPVKKIISAAKGVGAVTVIDGAQAVAHTEVDISMLGCDFYAFSGHKMLAPMGIGVLYGRKALLEKMDPYMLGGEMIEYVTREDATYAEVPHKFEAGTVNAGGAAGLAAACRYISKTGFNYIKDQENRVTEFLMREMHWIPGVEIYGSKDPLEHHGIISFNIRDCHPHDVASILNEDHICVRAGHHCAQPLMQYMGIGSCVRASVYAYNTLDEAQRFINCVSRVRKVLGY